MPVTILYTPKSTLAGCVEVYDNVLSYSREIINICEEENSWRPAEVYSHDTMGDEIDVDTRSNTVFDVTFEQHEKNTLLRNMDDVVHSYLHQYAEKYETNFSYVEGTQILKYRPGQDYKRHYDTGPEFPRNISALLYLNDVDWGGETEFVYFGLKVSPRAGRLVVFPSNYAYAHVAHPPEVGMKYVAVYWTRETIISTL